jgi:uncharacterized membrane protein YdbT with pleckstrin-like domain
MRLITNTDTYPASVARYLPAQEHMVITLHPHPAILLGPIGAAGAGLITAAILTIVANVSAYALLITWLVWGLLLLYLIARVIRWSENWFVVTASRLVVVNGLLARDVASMPLSQAPGMTFRRSFLGRVLGYGQLVFEPHGQDQALRSVNFVPYPEQIYLEICALIYPQPDYDEPEPRPSRQADQPGGDIHPEDDGWDDYEERDP